MPEQTYTGRCLCGNIRYQLTGPVEKLCYCHCESCRRASGAHCVAWGTVACERFAITQGELSIIRSSPPVERGFCGHCGATLTYQKNDSREEIDIALVSLDTPTELVPGAHIWVSDKLPWVKLDDDLPQYQNSFSG